MDGNTPALSRLGLFQGILPIQRKPALKDALAGFQLAAMNVPQALGYTKIAGTPVVTGFYTLLLPLVAFATLGSSRFLVVAADSATAAILAGGLSHMAPIASPHYMALASTVALLTGVFLILARILRLGFLANFLSQTVLVGFLTGVGFPSWNRGAGRDAFPAESPGDICFALSRSSASRRLVQRCQASAGSHSEHELFKVPLVS